MAQKRPRPSQDNGALSNTSQSTYATVTNDTEQMMENSGQQHFAATFGTMASAAQTERFMHAENQCTYQQIHQQKQEHLLQRLQSFWASQHKEIEKITEFRNHSLPLARIKRIMKADEDVRMISAEAPVVFAKACEMFILELTLRARYHTEECKRRTLQRNDIATAIAKTEIYDFLVDIIPREDQKDEAFSPMARNALPLRAPTDFTADYYVQDQQSPFSRAPRIDISQSLTDPDMYAPQFHPFMSPHLWLQRAQQPQSPADS